jgi:hypothetical protein
LRRMKILPLPCRPLNAGRVGAIVQGKSITAKRALAFSSRAVHARGMGATGQGQQIGETARVLKLKLARQQVKQVTFARGPHGKPRWCPS